MLRCLIVFLSNFTVSTNFNNTESPIITGSIRSPFSSSELKLYLEQRKTQQLNSAHYGISSKMLTSCAHANIRVDGTHNDFSLSTMTVSTHSVGTRDRRCILSSTLQEACLIQNIRVLDEKLTITARIHKSPSYNFPYLSSDYKYEIPSVTDIRRFEIDVGSLVVEASLSFSTNNLLWEPFCISCDSFENNKTLKHVFRRSILYVDIHQKADQFQSSYSCDESLSCHFYNVVLSDINQDNRAETDIEEQTIWLYSNKKGRKGETTTTVPCTNIPVTTTVHKRFVTNIGWRQGERPAIVMKNANDNKDALFALRNSIHHCIKSPSILFSIPFPSYYYHAVAEGAIPLASAILRGYNGRKDIQLVNIQRWGDFSVLPIFLQDILAALSDLVPLTLEQLHPHTQNRIANSELKSALCFQEMSTGFWPTLRTRKDFAGASEMLQKYVLQKRFTYPRPPTSWQLGMFEQTNVPDGPPVLYIVQRTLVDNLNFQGQEKKKKIKATRVIKNIDKLSQISNDLGYETTIIDLARMTLRKQITIMQRADVFVAVFGSAWANVVWMRRKGTTAIMLLGWGFKDGCSFQMPTQTPVHLFSGVCRHNKEGKETGARSRGTKFFYNDHCDAVIREFPALVDPLNTYTEIVAKSSEQFEAPFFLDDWICQHDKERFNKDYGEQTPENVARCMIDHQHTHKRAIANPSWAWENVGINAAHLFFLNANLWVETQAFEEALIRALSKITRIPKNTMPITQQKWSSNIQSTKAVKTCWISIDPNSDELVRILAKSALSSLSIQNKIIAHVIDAKIRFSVLNAGYADDMKIELHLECVVEKNHLEKILDNRGGIIVTGIITLMSNEQGTPFWFPPLLDLSGKKIEWKHQKSLPAWSESCMIDEGGLLAGVQHMMMSSASLYKRPFQRLMVRLEHLSQLSAGESKNTIHDFATTETFRKNINSWPVKTNYVVIGVAVNYGMDEFRRFVGSLRATKFSGTVILGVSPNISPECLRYLKRHDVEIRIVKDGDLTPKKREEDGAYYDFYNIALPRWILYRKWTKESNFSNRTKFLLTDTRDVYFQRDPFADLKHNDESFHLYMFTEWGGKTIGRCKHNSDWVRSCWGANILDQLSHHPILCSGTIFGSRYGINLLVDAMVMEAAHVKTLRHELDGKAKHGRPCINDQAYLNVLMRQKNDSTGILSKLRSMTKIFAQGDGPVNTIGWLAVNGSIAKDSDGFVLNNDGRRSAVVHQYDRDLKIQAWLDAKFVFVLDPIHETWVAGKAYANAIRTALLNLNHN
jgi:hypothetical protein